MQYRKDDVMSFIAGYLLGMEDGGGRPAVTEPLSVARNGIYLPPAGVDGFNKVDVNVPSGHSLLETIAGEKPLFAFDIGGGWTYEHILTDTFYQFYSGSGISANYPRCHLYRLNGVPMWVYANSANGGTSSIANKRWIEGNDPQIYMKTTDFTYEFKSLTRNKSTLTCTQTVNVHITYEGSSIPPPEYQDTDYSFEQTFDTYLTANMTYDTTVLITDLPLRDYAEKAVELQQQINALS